MTTDLPYQENRYMGIYLNHSLTLREPVNLVRLCIGKNEGRTYTSFFSRGDFRPDIVEGVERLLGSSTGYKFPSEWQNRILTSDQKRLKLGKKIEGYIEFGALDFKRLAQIFQTGWTKPEERVMDAEGNQIYTKEQLEKEFRGALVDQLINSSRYGPYSEMTLPPSEEELERMNGEVGQAFDKYNQVPKDSLVVTSDFIFPFVFGRKVHDGFRLKDTKYLGYSRKGPRLPTSERTVHFTGIGEFRGDLVFGADFRFPFDFIGDSFVVERSRERKFVEESIASMGRFDSIEANGISNLPEDILPEGARGRSSWNFKLEDFKKIVYERLGIN
jgi:hypothetical protein